MSPLLHVHVLHIAMGNPLRQTYMALMASSFIYCQILGYTTKIARISFVDTRGESNLWTVKRNVIAEMGKN